MEDYSKKRNKPSTQRGYQAVIDRCIVPLIGRKKVPDVKRPDIAGLMEKVAYLVIFASKRRGVPRCATRRDQPVGLAAMAAWEISPPG